MWVRDLTFYIKKLVFICLLFSLNTSVFAQHEHHTTPLQTPTSSVMKKFTSKPMKHKAQKQETKKETSIAMKQISPGGVERTVDLVISYKTVNFAGRMRKAIAVNDQIPAPTLHFKEGDRVTINVHNRLDKGTSIHWHGLLVPWQMGSME